MSVSVPLSLSLPAFEIVTVSPLILKRTNQWPIVVYLESGPGLTPTSTGIPFSKLFLIFLIVVSVEVLYFSSTVTPKFSKAVFNDEGDVPSFILLATSPGFLSIPNPLSTIATDVGPHPYWCIVPPQYDFSAYEPLNCL